MESASQKLKRNIREGTFFKNVPIALKNRLFKSIKTSNWIYFLDKERVATKKFQSNIVGINPFLAKAGNYYLDSRVPITERSIVYSLGVLTEISFDLHLVNNFGCQVFLYDPTPVSIQFMKQFKSNKLLIYRPVGVWIENTVLKFYEPKYGGSASVMRNDKTGRYFEAKCLTMESLMRENQHKKISIFKADIEGAALPILNQMIQNKTFPDQIVCEFERPQGNMSKVQDFFRALSSLRSNLAEEGYEEYLLPRHESKYYSLEMLFVKKNKIQHDRN